jgi:predicted O-methyltransferase YrrM
MGTVDAGSEAERRARLRDLVEPVEGLVDESEAWQLHEAVRRRLDAGRPPLVVEIGSWKGRSTVALAAALRPEGRGRVHAIDPHGQDDAGRPTSELDTYPTFLANLRAAGVADLVEVHRTTSAAARPRFEDRSVDVLFVDGSHELEDVLDDLRLWGSALADGAVVAINDIGFPGVNEAVRRVVACRGSTLRNPWFVFNTLFLEHHPALPWRRRDSVRLQRLRLFLGFIRRLNPLWNHHVARLPSPLLRFSGALAWLTTRALLRKRAYPGSDHLRQRVNGD